MKYLGEFEEDTLIVFTDEKSGKKLFALTQKQAKYIKSITVKTRDNKTQKLKFKIEKGVNNHD